MVKLKNCSNSGKFESFDNINVFEMGVKSCCDEGCGKKSREDLSEEIFRNIKRLKKVEPGSFNSNHNVCVLNCRKNETKGPSMSMVRLDPDPEYFSHFFILNL